MYIWRLNAAWFLMNKDQIIALILERKYGMALYLLTLSPRLVQYGRNLHKEWLKKTKILCGTPTQDCHPILQQAVSRLMQVFHKLQRLCIHLTWMHHPRDKSMAYCNTAITIANALEGEWRTLTLWRHQMETFSALLVICAGNSPVPGEFPTQRPVTRSFDVYFDLRPNKRLSKQSWGWWFETQSRPLWRHRNGWD